MIHCRRERNPKRGCSVLLCPVFFALCLLIFLWTASFSLARLFSPCSKKTGTQEITHSRCLFLILIRQTGKAEDVKFCRVAAKTVVREATKISPFLFNSCCQPAFVRTTRRAEGVKGSWLRHCFYFCGSPEDMLCPGVRSTKNKGQVVEVKVACKRTCLFV